VRDSLLQFDFSKRESFSLIAIMLL